MATKLSKEDIAEIEALFDQGASIETLAEEYGVSVSHLYSITKQREPGSKVGRPGIMEILGPEKAEELSVDYLAGEPLPEIMRKYGLLSYNQVYRILDKLGIPRREVSREKILAKQARLETAVQMYQQGYRYWQIAQETGLMGPQIVGELHKRGIKMRRDAPDTPFKSN